MLHPHKVCHYLGQIRESSLIVKDIEEKSRYFHEVKMYQLFFYIIIIGLLSIVVEQKTHLESPFLRALETKKCLFPQSFLSILSFSRRSPIWIMMSIDDDQKNITLNTWSFYVSFLEPLKNHNFKNDSSLFYFYDFG